MKQRVWGLSIFFCAALAASCTDEADSGDAATSDATATRDATATSDAGSRDATMTPRDTGIAMDALESDTGSTPDTGDTTDATDTTDAAVADTGAGDGGCVASGAEVCDGVDNDCDGLRDNVDVGNDGIYDCARIALFGGPGSGGSSDFNAWLASNGVGVVRTQTASLPLLTAPFLDRFDIIILDRLVRDYTPEEAELFEAWVEAGGGVMVMTGYSGSDSDRDRPGSLLAPFGLAYAPGLRNGPVTDFSVHPTTDGITSITFNGGFNVETTTVGVTGTSTVVARLPSGPVAVAYEQGDGRVFVFGDEWIEFDSEWRALPEIPRLWGNILGWLAHLR